MTNIPIVDRNRLPAYDGLPPSYERATRLASRSPKRRSGIMRVEIELKMIITDSIGREFGRAGTIDSNITLHHGLDWADFQEAIQTELARHPLNRDKSFKWFTVLHYVKGSSTTVEQWDWESHLHIMMAIGSLPAGTKDWPKKLVVRSRHMDEGKYQQVKAKIERNEAGLDARGMKRSLVNRGERFLPRTTLQQPTGLRGGGTASRSAERSTRSGTQRTGRSRVRTTTDDFSRSRSTQRSRARSSQRIESPVRGRSRGKSTQRISERNPSGTRPFIATAYTSNGSRERINYTTTTGRDQQTARNTERNRRGFRTAYQNDSETRIGSIPMQHINAERRMYLASREQRRQETTNREMRAVQARSERQPVSARRSTSRPSATERYQENARREAEAARRILDREMRPVGSASRPPSS